MSDLTTRLEYLLPRLASVYDGLGGGSGRPYVYFTYPLDHEREVRRLADEYFRDGKGMRYIHIDLLPLTVARLKGQEERRHELFDDPSTHASTAQSIAMLWTKALLDRIQKDLASGLEGRPVVVLRGLASLHPVTNPTDLMEYLADREPVDPSTGKTVPIVLLVPGVRPPGASRTYRFLQSGGPMLTYYRGEDC
jgi:hypothetical protein